MPDPEQLPITKENDDGELVTYLPANMIIGALEIEEKEEQADDESKTA